jgi:hypothetical protein
MCQNRRKINLIAAQSAGKRVRDFFRRNSREFYKQKRGKRGINLRLWRAVAWVELQNAIGGL